MNKTLTVKYCKYLVFAVIILTFLPVKSISQVDNPLLIFKRGKLWQSVYLGKLGPSTFNNWRKIGIGLDWPGFDATWIQENIGGAPSHMVAGGFWVGSKREDDSVYAVEDWSIYGSSVAVEQDAKYIVTRHEKIDNYWLQENESPADEVIITSWEYNPNYQNQFDLRRQLPIKVTRRSFQWSGSQKDENYIIHEYIFENIADRIEENYPERFVSDTLKGFHLLLNYGLHSNSRSWNVLFPNLTAGARNTWFFYDPMRKMIWGRAGDYLDTENTAEDFGFSPIQGPVVDGNPTGEWLAPGFVGVRLLYSSPNNEGQETHIKQYGWAAGDNAQDLIGPMSFIGSMQARYEVIKDPTKANNFVINPLNEEYMRRSRMWSMMSLGPWDMIPGDSVKVVFAEIVNGVDYRYALDPEALQTISSRGLKIFQETADRAEFTYENDYNHPDPPAAPEFEVSYYEGEENIVANEITWNDDKEDLPDPDNGTADLAGYRIYRSDYLPIGPWQNIADIKTGEQNYYDQMNDEYKFVDTSVTAGSRYYYSLTAYDTGKTSWSVDPSVEVDPLESSIFANRMVQPFVATVKPVNNLNEVLVVPNPFVIDEGYTLPGEGDNIQFVNIPNPCTIRIYTIRGDLVKTIEVQQGDGAIAEWDQVTDFGQFVESGIYIYHIDSQVGTKIGKFAIVR